MEAHALQTLYEEAKKAKSAEEIVELAKAKNITITPERAKSFFQSSGELSEEELDNVAGGCPDSQSSNPEGLKVGDRVYDEMNRHFCSCNVNEYIVEELKLDYDPPLVKLRCVKCQTAMYRQLAGHHVKN